MLRFLLFGLFCVPLACTKFDWSSKLGGSANMAPSGCAADPAAPTETCFVFVAFSGSDANPGTKASPKLTIAAGLATAANNAKTAVAVCAGTYAENPPLIVDKNIATYGGYNCATWTRTVNYGYPNFDLVNNTIVNNGNYGVSPNTLVFTGSIVGSSAVFDGFTVNGAAAGTNGSVGIRVDSGAAPRISNTKIVGGATTSATAHGSIGVEISAASPEVTQNNISGGTGSTSQQNFSGSVGLIVSGASAPVICNNDINGGSGTNSFSNTGFFAASTGIYLGSSLAMTAAQGKELRGNNINGGTGRNTVSQASGISWMNLGVFAGPTADADIVANYIEGGSPLAAYSGGSGVWDTAIRFTNSVGTTVRVVGNRIYGGDSVGTFMVDQHCLTLDQPGIVYVQNNLIHRSNKTLAPPATGVGGGVIIGGGGGTTHVSYNTIFSGLGQGPGVPTIIRAEFSNAGHTLNLDNNVVLMQQAGQDVFLLTSYATVGILKSLKNNAIMPGTGSIYAVSSGAGCAAGWSSGVAALETCVNAVTPGAASGNIAISATKTATMASWATDGWSEFQTGNWTLTTGIPAVSQAATNLGANQPATDFFGNARTAPYSIGAHEQEL